MKKLTTFLIPMILMASLCSCIRDEAGIIMPGSGGSGPEIRVKVMLRLPGDMNREATRAISETDEMEIMQVDALVFDKDKNYVYHSSANYFEDNGNPRSGYISLYTSEEEVYVHLYANSSSALAAANLPSFYGRPESEVIENITTGLPPEGHGWLKNPFPMWGKFRLPNVPLEGFPTVPTCKMLRSVARIDVGLDYDALSEPQGLANFELRSATVIRAMDMGQVARDSSIVADTYIPAGAGKADYTDSQYLQESALSGDGLRIERELYVYENEGGMDKYNAMCIIIGGYYQTDTDPCYYKVFIGDEIPSRPIVRNHCYRMNVIEVEDRGYPSIEEALNHEASNMIVVEVLEWDASDVNSVFDGIYRLATDKGEIVFDKYGGEQAIEVTTNYPDGFTVEASPGLTAWINSVTPLAGAANSAVRIVLDAPETTSGGHNDPDDYIVIKAGNMNKKIPVVQDYDIVPLGLQLSRNEFHFSLAGGRPYPESDLVPQTLELSWTPSNATVTISSIYPQGEGVPIAWDDPVNLQIQNNSGAAVFDMLAEQFPESLDPDPLRERSDFWIVTVTHPDHPGEALSRMISVKQLDYGLVIEHGKYIMDGDTYDFSLRSNADCQITRVGSGSNNQAIQSFPTVYPNTNTRREWVPFTTLNYTTNYGLLGDASYRKRRSEVVSFEFSSPDGLFPTITKDFELFGATLLGPADKANCMILADSDDAVAIPANWLTTAGALPAFNQAANITSDTRFDGELVWTDNLNWVVNPVDNDKVLVFACGKGANAKLYARRGRLASATSDVLKNDGNAVVALRINNSAETSNTWGDEIAWSWHIWGTDYKPDVNPPLYMGYRYFNRSLGCITDDPTILQNAGSGDVCLFYQWGRKDPYTGASNWEFAGSGQVAPEKKNYFIDGTEKIWKYDDNLMSRDELVKKPNVYNIGAPYNGTEGVSSWSITKTVYDPCPAGWRIPTQAELNTWQAADFPTATYPTIGFYRKHVSLGYIYEVGVRMFGAGGYHTWVGSHCYIHTSATDVTQNTHSTTLFVAYGGGFQTANGPTDKRAGFSVRCVKN